MKVLIVAKTRRGAGACVGGIREDGRSVRLIARNAAANERAGLEYEIGEVWEIESAPDEPIIPPHVENIIVLSARRLKRSQNLEQIIRRYLPPAAGGPLTLFDGLIQATPSGSLYVAEGAGLPCRSTMFWQPDQPLELDYEGKRIRYRYPGAEGGRTLTFVGFQEPLKVIPAGALLRVSLAQWWRPRDRPDEELRCYAQLSGWFLSDSPSGSREHLPRTAQIPIAAPMENRGEISVFAPDLTRARKVLKDTFGYSEFLPRQADVIARVLQRKDTLVVMPTGGGKSLCYQLPALLFEGLTVVISPLIALMHDQVSQLHQAGVPAAFLNHTVQLGEHVGIAKRIREGDTRILYVAPETLLRPEILLLLEQSNLACFAIDEAHCISEWGHDFRPEYRKIQQARSRFPQAVCVALTATATPRVREDICRLLNIPPEGEFVASFNRRNLSLIVEPRRDGLAQVLSFLEKYRGQSGIIYCGTRKQTDDMAADLTAKGWPALPYHAGLDANARRQNQDRFLQDDVSLMVATVAFGMGINKSNVRFVIHYNLPKDIESYYQEIGRAGRDGLPAECLLLYSRADAVVHRHFIDEGAATERPGRQARLNALMRYAEAADCRRIPLLAYFSETLDQPCGNCDNCIRPSQAGETIDAIIAAQKFLSCVKHTGEMFGPSHIIAILRGSRSVRVLSRRHDLLSDYGAGLEHSAEQWRTLADQFLRQSLMQQDLNYGGLRIAEKGWKVLAGEKVLVPAQHLAAGAPASAAPAECDRELFEQLRQLRKKITIEAGVPSYVIFSDRALTEMASFYPQTEPQFLAINGVGETKLANYGPAFLQMICDYCRRAGISSEAIQRAQSKPAPTRDRPALTSNQTGKRRFQEIGEQFAAGETLEAIVARYNSRRETVIQNLQQFLEAGGSLEPATILALSRLSASDQTRVLAAFEQLGTARLAPVYEALSTAISYDELHLLRLYLKCRERKSL